MSNLIGGIFLPYLSELILKGDAENSKPIHSLASAVEKTALLLKKQNPQTVVVLSPNGAVIEESVGLYVHPRLKGSFAELNLPELTLGFETDSLLMKLVDKQSNRLGIPIERLSDDVLEQYHLSAKLGKEALVLLYFLHKAGFKGQIVNLSYGKLLYEEMYTLGKAAQLAIEKSSKRVAAAIAVSIPFGPGEEGKEKSGYLEAFQRLHLKDLLQMDKSSLDADEEKQLRACFFLLGALGGASFAQSSFFACEIEERFQCAGGFFL